MDVKTGAAVGAGVGAFVGWLLGRSFILTAGGAVVGAFMGASGGQTQLRAGAHRKWDGSQVRPPTPQGFPVQSSSSSMPANAGFPVLPMNTEGSPPHVQPTATRGVP